MTAFNIVRFRVKPGHEQEFVDAHRKVDIKTMPGIKQMSLVKTGDRTYCFLGEWQSFKKIAAARPAMISLLDTFRQHLEDLGGGLGVTDPVSGEAVVTAKPRAKRKASGTKAKKAKKPAKRARRR